MRFNIVILAAVAGLAQIASGASKACAKNYETDQCLRAVVKAQNRHDRCVKHLRVKVTPAATTTVRVVTQPVTRTTTSTVTEFATRDSTATIKTTSFIPQTTTKTGTVTVWETISTLKIVELDGLQVRDNRLEPRKATTVKPTALPTYANACGSLPKYASACACIDVTADTKTAGAPKVTSTSTAYKTIISTVRTTKEATVTRKVSVTNTRTLTTFVSTETVDDKTVTSTETIYTATSTSLGRNGGFESGKFGPYWEKTEDSITQPKIVQPGNRGTKFALSTESMHDQNLLEINQIIPTIAGREYTCQYDWKFTKYYSTVLSDGPNIPYIHIYLNNEYSYIWWDSPDENTAGTWQTSTFSWEARGDNDRLWFDCASPQPLTGEGGGDNYLFLDNIACFEVGSGSG